MFKNDLKLLTYPALNRQTGELVTAESLRVKNGLHKLLEFLIERGSIVGLEGYDESCLKTYSKEVLHMIGDGDASWETMVPAEVAEVVKERGYFGFGARRKE